MNRSLALGAMIGVFVDALTASRTTFADAEGCARDHGDGQ